MAVGAVTAPAPYLRPPAGTRRAEGIPPCRERYALDQSTPEGLTPCQACCTLCGRATARRDPHGMPWCGGNPPTPTGDHA